jgi:potassium/chloride transporter 9
MDNQDHSSLKNKLDFWVEFVKENKIKAFVEHTTAPSLRIGSEQLLRLSGLGGMKPNTLVLTIDDAYSDLTSMLSDAIQMEKNLVLLKNLNFFDRSRLDGKEEVFIDIWPCTSLFDPTKFQTNFEFDQSSLFLLQLAALLSRQAKWRKNTNLRILIPIWAPSSQQNLVKNVRKSLETFRIRAEIILARNDLLEVTP